MRAVGDIKNTYQNPPARSDAEKQAVDRRRLALAFGRLAPLSALEVESNLVAMETRLRRCHKCGRPYVSRCSRCK